MKSNKIKIIEPTFFEDKRGYFTEVFRLKKLESLCNTNFVQQNESKSYFGVLITFPSSISAIKID